MRCPPAGRALSQGEPTQVKYGEEHRPFWLPEPLAWTSKVVNQKQEGRATLYEMGYKECLLCLDL